MARAAASSARVIRFVPSGGGGGADAAPSCLKDRPALDGAAAGARHMDVSRATRLRGATYVDASAMGGAAPR